jgi:hypothetical protein
LLVRHGALRGTLRCHKRLFFEVPCDYAGKLDEILRLSGERDEQLSNLATEVKALSGQVSDMAPVVQQVADAITFAKVGRTVFRFLMGIGIAAVPVLWWMADRWHIVGQLFKRAP